MSTDARLCSSCRKIDIETLAYVPLPADKSNIETEWRPSQADTQANPLIWWRKYTSSLLGSAASVARQRGSCDLCAFVLEATCRTVPNPLSIVKQLDHQDSGSIGGIRNDDELASEPPSESLDRTSGDWERNTEAMTIDINGRQFEVLLKVRGQPMMFNLSPVEFGRLNLVCWKGQQVEQLSVCRFVPIVSEGPRKKHPDHEFYGAKFQVLVHDAAAGLPIKGTGREIADLVDMDLMKSWIETCRSRHGDACERPHWLGTMQPVPGLRVIDVVAKSVVSAPPGCRYLALSYVWGASFLPTAAEAVAKSDLASMALSCNIAALGEEGGLACLALPRTIQDTITLTQALGERYLWVDALCIIQDDAEDIQRQTAAMDAVFSGAVLTVAAAAGSDADHGLPGIIPGSRSNTRRKTRLTNKLSLLSMVNDEVLVSEWTRRGWTFQERLLSRRMLFFTNSLVSWKCDLDTWNEETILEPENPVADFIFEHHHEPLSRSPNRFTLLDYAGYIRDYSRRKLSYGSDILPAFQGVMHCYEQATGERLHWGLAYRIVEMGSSLMWTTDSLNVKFGERGDLRRVRLDDGTTVFMRYPTWSWMGWAPNARYTFTDVYSSAWADCIRPEIDFYKLMSDGRAERLEPEKPPVPPGTPDDIGRQFTLPLTRLWKGSMTIDGPVSTHPGDQGLIQKLVPAATPGAESSAGSGSVPVFDTGRLVFWTSHARIKTWSKSHTEDPHPHLYLQMPGGAIVHGEENTPILPSGAGAVFFMAANTSARLFGRFHATDGPCDDGASLTLSYVVVGENFLYEQWRQAEDTKAWSPEGRVRPALNALIVEWIDEEKGVARRIGVAQFFEEEWIKLDRDWRRVILE